MRPVITVALTAVLLAGCAPKSAGGDYRNVSVTDLKAAVEGGAAVLDVRTAAEFAEGHIGGAANIPLDSLGARTGELDPAQPLYVICRSGSRSAQASALLVGAGFRDIRNVTGGMNDWQAAGYPVAR
ncbi:rhodanese-like domain-containing protein [Deinococcus ficus]|uniref:Rhodanese-like domain-containing protein n=1 Tax=Deinococcus ficus TaxID=317577 RepID=A0A221T2D2_9DEIO|nr:rhodanese-like domain-containing protein [Deinococcus ficus]ASN83020.1 rhodanese-like domain-containing protein [Deinococcus ficus]